MTPRTLRKGLLLAATLAAATAPAAAADVAFVFTLDWQSGPLTGSTSQGTLSFDASLVAPNAQYLGPSSLDTFSLTIGNRAYGVGDVGTGILSFDASSAVRLLEVGTDCSPGACIAGHDPASFFMVYDSQSQLDRLFAAAGPPDASQSFGVGDFQPAPVPEPSSLMLLLSGLGVFALRRRAGRGPQAATTPFAS